MFYRGSALNPNRIPYVSVVSLFGRVEIISGRPRPQLSFLGHGRFEQIRVRCIRYPGRVRRITTVSRPEISVRYRHDDGAVLFAHRSDRVRIVRVGQVFLKV